MRQRSLEHSEIKVQSAPENPHEALNLLILYGKKTREKRVKNLQNWTQKNRRFESS
jgi:hypothetical protein